MEPAADESLSRMLSKIAQSHEEFMANAMEGVTQSLMRHNVLLATELRALKARDGVERVVVEPPRVPAFPDACPSTPSRTAWGATVGAHSGRVSRALSPAARRKARGANTRPRISVVAHSDGESDSSEQLDRSLALMALEAPPQPPEEGDASLRCQGWKLRLNTVVVTMVIVNLFAMGFSVDFQPEHRGWFALEVVCTAVFVFEAAIKMYMEGIREFFRGSARHWNMVDVIVTLFALLDMTYSIHLMEESHMGKEASVSSATRIAIGARVLRIVRVVRLMKLMHSPVLRDLANMLTGFVIGVPSLIWVLALFSVILYMLGLFFRLMLGPSVGQNMLSLCGRPDDYVQVDNEDCHLHYMYGEEFFGTVAKSMFTVFRFMLSDYSTMGGKSMIVAFSQGYGMKFDIVFVGWMIFVIFGMFNIITAIFVDTTVCGLKHNDVKRKYARQYERQYVKAKLKSLIERVKVLHTEMNMPRVASLRHAISESKRDSDYFELEEEEFVQVMEDGQVKALLEDLDVMMFNPVGLFDTFDPDGDGRVTMQAMVLAILKLRGEPQKNDIIASVVALRSLHEKVDHMELALAQLAQIAQQDRLSRASSDAPKPLVLKR